MTAIRAHLEHLVRRDLRASAAATAAVVDEDALRRRIDDYYLPVYRWTEALVHAVQTARAATATANDANAPSSCVVVGLSCVQGGGKTTLVTYLEELLQFNGKRCATLSLDDVYLTRRDQVALAAANPTNPLLEVRTRASRALHVRVHLWDSRLCVLLCVVPRQSRHARHGTAA